MSILIIAAGGGVHLFGVVSMSSNDCRMSSVPRRLVSAAAAFRVVSGLPADRRLRHAAVNAGRWWLPLLACWAGGDGSERGEPATGAGRGGTAAREPGGRAGVVVHRRRRVLPGRGQGAG